MRIFQQRCRPFNYIHARHDFSNKTVSVNLIKRRVNTNYGMCRCFFQILLLILRVWSGSCKKKIVCTAALPVNH